VGALRVGALSQTLVILALSARPPLDCTLAPYALADCALADCALADCALADCALTCFAHPCCAPS
jgi:hypothetical protein